MKQIRNYARDVGIIKEATDVNCKHADMMKTESIARHNRSRIQVRSEVMENRQIDYKSHMKWLEN